MLVLTLIFTFILSCLQETWKYILATLQNAERVEYKKKYSPEPYISTAVEIHRLSSVAVSWSWVPTCLMS